MNDVRSTFETHVRPHLGQTTRYARQFYESLLCAKPLDHPAVQTAKTLMTALNDDGIHVLAAGATAGYRHFMEHKGKEQIPQPYSLSYALYCVAYSNGRAYVEDKLGQMNHMYPQINADGLISPESLQTFKEKFPRTGSYYDRLQELKPSERDYETIQNYIERASQKIDISEFLTLG